MKTYNRKRHEYQEIKGVVELCRLCLNKAGVGVPIFNDNQDVCAAVAMRIMICVGLEMKHEDSLPNIICLKCYDELEKYYKFRKKCEVSYQKLKLHVLALKEKNHKDTLIESLEEESKDEIQHEEKQLVIEEKEEVSEPTTEQSLFTSVNNISPEKIVVMEELQIPMQTEVNPDIGTFLTTVLTELGILGAEEGGLVLRDGGISSFELETGDDEQLMLEFVEEDDDVVPSQEIIKVDQSSQESVDLKEGLAVTEDTDGKSKQKSRKGGSKTSRARARAWCPVCGRVFASASAAARHAAAHGGARPHACATCRRAFAQKAVLQRHMLVHREVRPHACSLCHKSFTQRGSLAAHMRAHAGAPARALRLHRCAACDKVFLYASGLSRHAAAHAGRVFACGDCDKTFKDRSSLKRHLTNFSHSAAEPS